MKIAHLAAICEFALLTSGCASIVSSTEQTVPVTSDPPGATVQIGEQTVTTPGTLKLKRKEDCVVHVSMPGYYDDYVKLHRQESPLLLGNLLWDLPTTGLFLFITQGMAGFHIVGPGSVYDRYTGAGYDLTPGKIQLTLAARPAEEPAARSGPERRPPQPRIAQKIPVGGFITSVRAGFGSVWVTHQQDQRPNRPAKLLRIDAQTGAILGTLEHPAINKNYFVQPDALWFVQREHGAGPTALTRLDLNTMQFAAPIPLPDASARVTVGEGAIWVLIQLWERRLIGKTANGVEVQKLDPATGQVLAHIPVATGKDAVKSGALWAGNITTGLGAVWVTNQHKHTIVRIDPQTGQVAAPVVLPHQLNGITVADQRVWLFETALPGHPSMGYITPFDPSSNQVQHSFSHNVLTADYAVGLGAVWMLDHRNKKLQWIATSTGRAGDLSLLPVAMSPLRDRVIAVDDQALWVAESDSLLRILP
jgi:streptogramin lyase